jgi:hypothetical protein
MGALGHVAWLAEPVVPEQRVRIDAQSLRRVGSQAQRRATKLGPGLEQVAGARPVVGLAALGGGSTLCRDDDA